jgi:hypothetical protein
MRDILAQLDAAVATSETLYDCPRQTTVDDIVVTFCNRGAAADAVRISVAKAGVAIGNEQYFYYDFPLTGNDTFMSSIGAVLRAGDIMRCYSATGSTTFTLTGEVISPAQDRR